MQIIKDSAEHHLLTMLENIKEEPAAWVGIHAALSRAHDPDAMIKTLTELPAILSAHRDDSSKFMVDLASRAESYADVTIYQFADNDILLIARPGTETQHNSFYTLFKSISGSVKPGLIDFISFGRDMMGAQKLADDKFLSVKRMDAYDTLCDENKIASIGLRRQKRDHAIVQVVEDDRFTATYTTGILSKDYELVHSKNGEEAIVAYIEHAPDIVFLDIHLPGLNGHETLNAIRRADPDAHVVIVSVDTARNNVMQANDQGAAGFLKKPFSRERILSFVERSPFIKGSKSIVNRT